MINSSLFLLLQYIALVSLTISYMLTLPIYAEVYRFLALSPAYRFYFKIYRFSSKYVPCFGR